MVRLKKAAATVFLVCLIPTIAIAHKENKAYILGGYLSCGQYVVVYEKDTYKDGERFSSDGLRRQVVWLKGFFSAYNLKVDNNKKNVLQGRDWASVLLWYYNFCNADPLNNTFKATLEFLRAMGER